MDKKHRGILLLLRSCCGRDTLLSCLFPCNETAEKCVKTYTHTHTLDYSLSFLRTCPPFFFLPSSASPSPTPASHPVKSFGMSRAAAHIAYPEALTEGQRALLAQFELRTISAPEGTPVLVVEPESMRYADASSTESSSRSSSAPSRNATQAAGLLTAEILEDARFTHSDTSCGCAANTDAANCASLPQQRPHLIEALIKKEEGPAQLQNAGVDSGVSVHLETRKSFVAAEDERGARSTNSEVGAPYVTSVAPLFRCNHDTADATGVKTSLCGSGAERISDASRAAALDDDRSLEERCQQLANRLVQLSTEVDAIEFDLDHKVPPPSEFF